MKEDDRARRKAEKKAQKIKERRVVSDLAGAQVSDPFSPFALLGLRANQTEVIPGLPSNLFKIILKDDEQDSQ